MLNKRNLINYTCSECGKSFDRISSIDVVSCPYCQVIREEEISYPDLYEVFKDVMGRVIKDITDYAEGRFEQAQDEIRDEIRYAIQDHKERK
jgi:hypothetical protein